MRKARTAMTALALLLLFVAAAQNVFAQRDSGRQAREEAAAGGWLAAYSGELTAQEAERGLVEPGLSIFAQRGSRDMEAVHDWADELVRQAAAGLRPAAARAFSRDERLQARRFAVRAVRELLRARQTGSEQTGLLSVEVKAGVLKYKDRSRSWSRRDGGGPDLMMFVPYVALREKQERGFRDRGSRQEAPPVMQSPQQLMPDSPEQSRLLPPPSSAAVLNALSLTNTARPLSGGRWEWTARIDGPAPYLRRIRSVTYLLHPTFKPSVQQGDSSQPGHPLTAIGWGVFELTADVVLNDGTRRAYRHMLRFR